MPAEQDETNARRATQRGGHTSHGDVTTETPKQVQTGEGMQTVNAAMNGNL